MLFSLPAGTEMFHFPAFPPHSLCVQLRVTTHNRQPGFPIRTSWDQSSVINSPRLFADSHVLHRLLMPRHSPCALKNLATQKPRQTPQPPQPTRGRSGHDARLIRCSRPLCSSQTTTPHPHPTHPTGHAFQKQGNQTKQQPPHTQRACDGPVASGPNSVSTTPAPPQHHTRSNQPSPAGVLKRSITAPVQEPHPQPASPLVSQEPTNHHEDVFFRYSTHEHHTPGTNALAGGFYTQPPPQPMQATAMISFAP